MLQQPIASCHTMPLYVFQSPLHRGTCFNRGEGCGIEVHSALFQSPLHRGTCFNAQRAGCRQALDMAVSVPSSSGHMLQPRETIETNSLSHVSVPSSSGHMLQRHLCPAALRSAIPCFSPLFIGAHASTMLVQITVGSLTRFSPLFIGAHASTFR